MQYNGESNSQDICTLSEKLSKSNSISFPIAEKTLYANTKNKEILTWIFSSYGGWTYQDSNDTSDPYADINAVANTNKVAIPSGVLELIGVSYLDSSTNEYNPLKPITIQEIQDRGYTLQNFMNTSGIPEYYLPLGDNLYIFPALSSDLTSGFRAYFSRGSSSFTVTDTTKTPGFLSEFHEALETGMALMNCIVNQKPMKNDLQLAWDGNEAKTGREGGYKKMIKKYYSQRYKEMFPPRITNKDLINDYI